MFQFDRTEGDSAPGRGLRRKFAELVNELGITGIWVDAHGDAISFVARRDISLGLRSIRLETLEGAVRAVGGLHGIADLDEPLLNLFQILVQPEFENIADRSVIEIRSEPAR